MGLGLRGAAWVGVEGEGQGQGRGQGWGQAAPGPRPAQGASAAREAGCGGGARLMGSAARWTKSVHASMGQPRGERSGSDLKPLRSAHTGTIA